MNFDRVAHYYDRLVALSMGKVHARSHQFLLQHIPQGSSILIVGGGTGEILVDLIRSAKPRQILYLEASPAMLELASKRVKRMFTELPDYIHFRLGREDQLDASESFEVILTPFVLDIFEQHEMKQIVKKLDTHLLPGGYWGHLDFYAVSRRLSYDALFHCAMYSFFRWISSVQASQPPNYSLVFDQMKYEVMNHMAFPLSVNAVIYRK